MISRSLQKRLNFLSRVIAAVAAVAFLVAVWLLWPPFAGAQDSSAPARKNDDKLRFNRDVRPILVENCFACHGPDSAARKADLRLDKRDVAIQAQAIDPGHAADSRVIQRINAKNPKRMMPPPASGKKLTAGQKELLKRWIDEGAEYQPHWSYIAPQRPEVPTPHPFPSSQGRGVVWVRNPIDAFILAKLEERGQSPAPEADRRALARRLSLDVTGLPPSPAEVEAFVNDKDANAYEKLVDRWLASPDYGEHRARHWLDAARYADTHGLHFDNYREIWPYRDWVIDAFNRNEPFDRFTIEQIAGDLLPGATVEQRVATGFHRCNITTNEGGTIAEENLALYAKDRVETTATVWLGLTAGCASCHDHKFDAIPTKEFYQFAAYFRNTTQSALDGNVPNSGPVVILPDAKDKQRLAELQKRAADVRVQLEKTMSKFVNSQRAHPGEPAGFGVPHPAAWLEKVGALIRLAGHVAECVPMFEEIAKLEREKQAIERRSPVTHVMEERKGGAPTARVLYRGRYDQPKETVNAGVFSMLHPLPKDAPANRLGLARWLIAPENPLTARVTVNRFWQEVFGQGLVKTSEDFGVSGQLPSHPELLDWLAVEFRDSGWDVKKLFRLMLTSATYRQSAKVTKDRLQHDPANLYLSRGPRGRMDAEMVRDHALAVSGLLVKKIGGPSVKPYQPDGIWDAVAMRESGTRVYKQDKGENLYRRSMYTFWKRAAPPASMDILNAPSREFCTVRRERTNTPLQALVTLNDPQFIEAARNLAQLALKNGGDKTDSRIDFIARRLLSRPFRAEEVKVVTASYDDLLKFYQAHEADAKKLLAVGESRPDPALDVPTLAAWTMVANELMNLDEALNK